MTIRTLPLQEEVLVNKLLSHLNMIYPVKFNSELLISSESRVSVSKNISYDKRMIF